MRYICAMKNWLKAALLVLMGGLLFSCGGGGERGSADIEHAIFMLGDRRKSEQRIIRESLVIRAQLEENSSQANSEGMRDKIAKEIQIIDLGIEKAKTNIANQDTIILQLQAKLDSLNAMAPAVN